MIGVGVQGCTSIVKTSGSSFKTGVCNLEKKNNCAARHKFDEKTLAFSSCKIHFQSSFMPIAVIILKRISNLSFIRF